MELLMLAGFFVLGMLLCEMGVPLWANIIIGIIVSLVVNPLVAEASPLLAEGNTVTGYLGVFVVFFSLIALGIFFGKRDRPKVKADLLGNPKVRYVTKDEVSKKGKVPL